MFKKLINLELSKNQQSIINLMASIINILVTTLIGFVLSPYITRTIGIEANGFVNLANTFIAYASLARTAIDSMGSRFLMMAYYNNQFEKFKKIYSSLFFADVFLAFVFGSIGALCVWKLEFLLDVPSRIKYDVKLLFAFLFLNFIISTALSVFTTCCYVKNKLYLDSITNTTSSVIRFLMIVGLFLCLSPRVYFVGIGTLISGILIIVFHFYFKKNLFPDIKAKIKYFSFESLRELISSGIWNTISSLGSILTNGMDLLVANLFVGPTLMGVLSVAKTMPSFVDTLNYTIANVFTPSLIIDYAKENKDEMVKTIKKSAKLISVICSLPLGFLIVYGKEFYSLWQPTQDAKLLHILSVITIAGRVFFTGMQPLFNVFTVVNKVKPNAIVTVLNGIISVIVVFILLKTTNLGVFAIAGVSVVCCFFKNIIYVIPYSAKYLGLKKSTFFSTLTPSILCSVIVCAWGYLEKIIFKGNTWIELILAGVVFVVVGVFLTAFSVLNNEERKLLYNMVFNKIRK